jgi:hypothetical protein
LRETAFARPPSAGLRTRGSSAEPSLPSRWASADDGASPLTAAGAVPDFHRVPSCLAPESEPKAWPVYPSRQSPSRGSTAAVCFHRRPSVLDATPQQITRSRCLGAFRDSRGQPGSRSSTGRDLSDGDSSVGVVVEHGGSIRVPCLQVGCHGKTALPNGRSGARAEIASTT